MTERRHDRLVAAKIGDAYRMYWGEGVCFGATSPDLVRWTPLEFEAGADRYLSYDASRPAGPWNVHRVSGAHALRPLLFPRPGRFDSLLVEPGPPAVRTEDGVLLIYNGADLSVGTQVATYQPGQALFDPLDPWSPIARAAGPVLRLGDTVEGQVDNVCFAQGLALFRGSWLLYYGMADSQIGYATAPS